MNDVERELRTMFARREHDTTDPPRTPAGLIRRTRMRQVLLVATSIVTLVVVAIGSLAVIRTLSRDDRVRPANLQVVLPDAPPGYSSAALPYASIAYPEDWYLLDTSPLVPYGTAPPSVAPRIAASAIVGEESRMSRPIAIRRGSNCSTYARPIA